MQKRTILLAFSFILFLSAGYAKTVGAGHSGSIKSPSAAASDDGVAKEKSYSKSYPLSAGDRVSIKNQFGKMVVNTWDKNEVKVDVHISVKADNDNYASALLDQIHIEDGKDGSEVRFHTIIDEHKNEHGRNTSMNIDYVVYLPASQTLSLSNSFGPTTMPDYSGALELTSKFGYLQAGNLSNVKTLDVEFNKDKLNKIGSVNGGDITLKFSNVRIGAVSGNIHGDFEFCSPLDIKLTSGIKGFTVKNSYTSLHLALESGIPAKFDIYTNFGNLDNRSNYSIKDDSDSDNSRGPKFTKNYSGISGDGSVYIRIKDEFGSIDIS